MIAALLSALLLTLSLPPYPLPALAPVALAPLAFHLTGLPATPDGARKAALAGVVLGTGHAILLLHWLPGAALPLLGPVRGMAGALAVWGLNGALTGAVVALAHRGMHGGGLPLPLALGAGWVVLGWAPTALPTVGFPWLGPEAALVERPELLGPGDVVGGAGVAGLLAFSGGAVGQWVARWRTEGDARRGIQWVALAGALLVASAGYGTLRAVHLGSGGESLRVAAVSLEADPALLSDRDARERRLPATLHRVSRELGTNEADLLLWPESPTGAVDVPVEAALARYWAERRGVSVAYGALADLEGGGLANRVYLEVAGADPGESMTRGRRVVREKRRLIPVVEQAYGGRGRSTADAPVEGPFPIARKGSVEGDHALHAGVLICFESLFAGEALRLRRRGARLLLLPSNEGWLTGRGGGLGEGARLQHRAAAVLRAVEARTPVVRSAVGGTAGAWDAAGRWIPGDRRDVVGAGYLYLATVAPGPVAPPPAARGGAAAAGWVSLILLLGAAGLRGRNRPPGSRVWRR